MFVRDVTSLRIFAVVALGVALLFTSVRAAHCERSRDLLSASIVTELADDGAPAHESPLSHAPVDDGVTLDRPCTSIAEVVPARAFADVHDAAIASYVARSLSPRRIGFSLERPPRCC